MRLEWQEEEFSVGRYVYMVYDADTKQRLYYVWKTTPRAFEFVTWLCVFPEKLADVQARLSPGKEVRAEAINILMKGY